MIFYIALVLTIFLLFVFSQIYTWPSFRTRKFISQLPGYTELNSWAFAWKVLFLSNPDILQFILNLGAPYPEIGCIWLVGIPFVLINKPEYYEVLLKSVQNIRKGFEYYPFYPWLREGLLTSTGSKWHESRKLLTPAFHFRILECCLPIFNDNVQLLIDILKKNCKTKEVLKLEDYIPLCTLDIIAEAAMGVKLDAQSHNSASVDFVRAVRRMSEIYLNRLVNVLMIKDWIYGLTAESREQKKLLRIIHGFTENVITESRKKRLLAKDNVISDFKPKAFVDFLLEMADREPESFSDIEIRQEVDTFMVEGYETTSLTISWTLLLLGSNQHIQERAHREIQEVLGDSDRHATKEDLSQMFYLEAIIKESLRLYPPVGFISRMLDSDMQFGKYTVPAGSNVSMFLYRLHRISRLYPDPEKFDPDRFLSLDNKRQPFMYIPFSGGPRNCIGQKFAMMELKVVLSTIIRHFKVESVTQRETMKIQMGPFLKPIDGIYVKLYPRF